MVKFLSFAMILLSLSQAYAAADGFLLITVEKFTYANSDPSKPQRNVDVKQRFKTQMSPQFLSHFNKLPTAMSSGSLFYCAGGDIVSSASPGVQFTQWFSPKADGKINTWFWGEGSEQVGSLLVSAHNVKAQTTIRFPSWETIDTHEMLGFVNQYDGVNISFSVRAASKDDSELSGALEIPVKAVDGTIINPGDSQSGVVLKVHCAFQNG